MPCTICRVEITSTGTANVCDTKLAVAPPAASAAKVNLQLDPNSRSIQISWASEGGMEVAPALAAAPATAVAPVVS